jgi:hypothetical protein
MGDPHRKERYGELWNQHKLDTAFKVLELLKEKVVVSGGWAWHLISPPGHPEYKHAHDHKDIDIFSDPETAWDVITTLVQNGFRKIGTRFDNQKNFTRFETFRGNPSVKITIDFFTRKVPFEEIKGFKVIDIPYLLSLYGDIHSSDKCFAVMTAKELLAKGLSPKEIIDHPDFCEIRY